MPSRERERERNLQVYRDKSPEIEREIIMCRERYLQGQREIPSGKREKHQDQDLLIVYTALDNYRPTVFSKILEKNASQQISVWVQKRTFNRASKDTFRNTITSALEN